MDGTLLDAVAASASAVAAIASVIVAVMFARRAEAFAAAQRRHASFETVAEWRRDLREWANEVIDVVSQAAYVCGDLDSQAIRSRSIDSASVPPVDLEQTLACRHRLSSLIDRGRFFLPNIRKMDHGFHKPPAYRGLRHPALDPLVAAERVLSLGTTGRFNDRKDALVAMRREFVSSMHHLLDPEAHNREVARMVQEGSFTRNDDPTLGGLLLGDDVVPPGAAAMLTDGISSAPTPYDTGPP